MKTTFSLPDDLFRKAHVAARQLSVSRSHLYAAAIAEYLERRQERAITERPNEIYSRQPSLLDPALHRAQVKTLDKNAIPQSEPEASAT